MEVPEPWSAVFPRISSDHRRQSIDKPRGVCLSARELWSSKSRKTRAYATWSRGRSCFVSNASASSMASQIAHSNQTYKHNATSIMTWRQAALWYVIIDWEVYKTAYLIGSTTRHQINVTWPGYDLSSVEGSGGGKEAPLSDPNGQRLVLEGQQRYSGYQRLILALPGQWCWRHAEFPPIAVTPLKRTPHSTHPHLYWCIVPSPPRPSSGRD